MCWCSLLCLLLLLLFASLSSTLYCGDCSAGTGLTADTSPCCNNCVQQFALYFDYSYPCWEKQGGEVMQQKTENQIDKNYFVWDTAYYRWKCAGMKETVSNIALSIVIAAIMKEMWW